MRIIKLNSIKNKLLLVSLLFAVSFLLLAVFLPAQKSINKENRLTLSSPSPVASSVGLSLPTSSPAQLEKRIQTEKNIQQENKNLTYLVSPKPSSIPEEQKKEENSAVVESSPVPTQQVQQLRVSLSIDGSAHRDVNIASAINQCDVLSHALAQGVITKLDMRYNETFKTYGVYKINDLGQDSQVWWTYKINGKSPSQGCSFISANDKDTIEWIYVGPR